MIFHFSLLHPTLLCIALWERYSRVRSLLQLPYHPVLGREGLLPVPQLVWWPRLVPSWAYHRGNHLPRFVNSLIATTFFFSSSVTLATIREPTWICRHFLMCAGLFLYLVKMGLMKWRSRSFKLYQRKSESSTWIVVFICTSKDERRKISHILIDICIFHLWLWWGEYC